MKRRGFCGWVAAGGLGALSTRVANAASDDRTQPIRIVVGFAPGGATDVLARAIATRLAEVRHAAVVVENRVGAGGTIAAAAVARAKPDGTVLAFASTGAFSIAPSLYAKLPYDAAHAFAPIALVAEATYALVVDPARPVTDVASLVAYANAEGDRMTYGSFGYGSVSHLLAELFKARTHTPGVHVPYAGSPALATATMTGDVAYAFDTLQSTLPHIRSGRLRGLAVVADRRSTVAPDLPTFAEQGVTGLDLRNWYGFVAPVGTPPAIVDGLAADIDRIVAEAAFVELCAHQGAEAAHATGAGFGRYLADAASRWGALARQSGARVE